MTMTLADIYQTANISLQPETFAARQLAVSAIRQALTDEHSVILARFYFGLSVNENDSEWFRSEVAKTDQTFSLVHKEREAAVIAEAILWDATKQDDQFAATVVAAAAISGLRTPIVNVDHIDMFKAALRNMAVRTRTPISTKFKSLPAMTVTAAEFSAAGSLPAAGELYIKGFEELRKSAQVALNETQKALVNAVEELNETREEVDILSWLIGGWSRLLGRPFTSLSLGVAAVAAGIDLADLSGRIAGPFAAPSLIQRVLLPVKKPKAEKVSLLALGDAFSPEDVRALNFSSSLSSIGDLCPVLTALSKRAEIGSGSWTANFEQLTGLGAKSELSFEQLAIQAMHERMVTVQL
jgi:hypothetical protein